ncbi:hypothetical protein L6R46_17985, partial [Myxococcota bacterium]|nr:hypothetical protein [Myxococcota bacterium]
MRLTRLKIIRHRWCAPTELILGAKRQLVLGKNGTGKTKLLELIARVCAGDLPWLMAEPIEFEADWSVEETSLERTNGAVSGVLRLTFSCEHRPMQQHSERAPLIDYGRSPGPKVQFRLTFEASPESMLKDLDWQCSHGQVTASNGVGGLLDVVRNATIWDNTIGKYTNHLLSGTGRFSLDELAMYSLLLGLHAVRR